jgi:hypothetical protein
VIERSASSQREKEQKDKEEWTLACSTWIPLRPSTRALTAGGRLHRRRRECELEQMKREEGRRKDERLDVARGLANEARELALDERHERRVLHPPTRHQQQHGSVQHQLRVLAKDQGKEASFASIPNTSQLPFPLPPSTISSSSLEQAQELTLASNEAGFCSASTSSSSSTSSTVGWVEDEPGAVRPPVTKEFIGVGAPAFPEEEPGMLREPDMVLEHERRSRW